MSDGLRVEVRVRGRVGGDLLALVGDLVPRVVPRHTVLLVGPGTGVDDGLEAGLGGDHAPGSGCPSLDAGSLTRLLTHLERAGVELDQVLACDLATPPPAHSSPMPADH